MENSFEIHISPQQVGLRVDKLFSDFLKDQWSRSYIQRSIREGGLKVCNRTETQLNYRVKLNDICLLTLVPSKEFHLQPCQESIDILYEDSDIIVVNKQEGKVVHPGNGVTPGTTLVEALLSHCPLSTVAGSERPGVVHRLDQATSGVILFAKTDAAYWNLTRMFAERKIHKTYHALVWGIPRCLSGTIESPIGRSTHDRTAMCITTQGRNACTNWKCLDTFPQAHMALLACYPITGRTHQIRVHLKSIGHTIVGDPKYGKIKDQRLFLHAYQIEFDHPVTHQPCCFNAPWPTNFKEKIQFLMAHNPNL